MSSKSDVWTLLLKRQGEWLSRQEIEFVGGPEAMRRLREIRATAYGAGYQIESRSTGKGADEYRITKIGERNVTLACVKCGHAPAGVTQRTVDSRWEIGKCAVCDKRDAIFRVVGEAASA